MSEKIESIMAKQMGMLYSGRTFEYKAERYVIEAIVRTKVEAGWILFVLYENEVNGLFSRELNDFLRKFKEIKK